MYRRWPRESLSFWAISQDDWKWVRPRKPTSRPDFLSRNASDITSSSIVSSLLRVRSRDGAHEMVNSLRRVLGCVLLGRGSFDSRHSPPAWPLSRRHSRLSRSAGLGLLSRDVLRARLVRTPNGVPCW